MKIIAEQYKALGDENRLRILNLIVARGELCVCDIQRVLDAPQARISRHLAYLKNTGWVEDRRQGLWIMYRLSENLTEIQKKEIEIIRSEFSNNPQFKQDLDSLGQKVQMKELSCCT